jgi:VWFA-related protein
LTRHLFAFGLACLCTVAIGAARQTQQQQRPAEQTPPQPVPRPTFKSEANYIRVDAFVTKDGRPVEDLRAEDFEVLEDGKPQRIDAFEHVHIEPAGPQVTRIEPNSQEAANQMAEDPRARIFVVFLDVDHVPVEGSFRLKTALATMLSQMLGQDDMLGVITSRNSPSDLILARKTSYVEEQLEKYWYWGRRDSIVLSPEEDAYLNCYTRYEGGQQVAEEMIDRRREKLALDALSDLVIHLRGIREERKAVLTISTGWPLYRPNRSLERPLVAANGQTHIPQPPPIVVGPGGKIMSGDDPRDPTMMSKCDRDRMELANIDDWQAFRNLTQDANRANVSFYPVDPRGLVVFDSPIGPRRPPPPSVDLAILRERQNNLRTMAEETDGLAVVNTTDLNADLRRIADDLTSYYLIGYYTSNPALDGKYHRISVRVKRPGMEVRARKGYRSATAEEVARGAASAAAATANGATDAARNVVSAALGRLSLIRPDAALYLNAVHQPGGPVWVIGEVPLSLVKTTWARGGRVSLMAVDGSGATVGVARKEIAAGSRDFIASIPLDDPSKMPARIQVRAEPEGAPAVGVEVAPRTSEPLLLRRTATGLPHAAADFRYYRTETLVYRWVLAAGESVAGGRVLDRAGNPMPLTITPAEETADGARWLAGTLTLAPLTTGDYLLELTKRTASGETKSLVPFRVVR